MNDNQEDRLDPEIEAELRRIAEVPALDQLSRMRLKNRIMTSAGTILRPLPSWWEVAARWAKPLVPAAAAAALLMTVLIPDARDTAGDLTVVDPVDPVVEWSWLEDEVAADDRLTDPEGFLLAVISEEW